MTVERLTRADTIIAHVLRWGAYLAFALMLAGVILAGLKPGHLALTVELIGVVTMMATPVVRVLVTVILFAHRRDWRYTLVTSGVLIILLLGSVFGIGEH